jgi:hypothetical protein
MDPLSVETSDSDESLETEAPAGGGEDSVDEGDFNPSGAPPWTTCADGRRPSTVYSCAEPTSCTSRRCASC